MNIGLLILILISQGQIENLNPLKLETNESRFRFCFHVFNALQMFGILEFLKILHSLVRLLPSLGNSLSLTKWRDQLLASFRQFHGLRGDNEVDVDGAVILVMVMIMIISLLLSTSESEDGNFCNYDLLGL